uniref:Hexosyltransferase n=1 Tax=Alexandrium catenella TaxID=2925 RepID=A0A7S1KWT2_ALECA
MLTRLNRMLSTATLMLHEAGLPSEIIVVEWNPPVGKAPIAEVVSGAPGTQGSVPIRVIRVPPALHMTLPHHKAHPIFEHIAENVAFRRARGRFILKTNIDNIMSPDTAIFLARQQLREDCVYRATYAEYDVDVPETRGLEGQALLEWLFSREDLLTNVNLQLGELSAQYPEDTQVCAAGRSGAAPRGAGEEPRPFYWAGSGDFVLASRELVLHVRGYPQIAQNWQTDDLIHCRLRAAGARQVVLQPPCVTVHQNHRRINRVRSSTRWVVTDGNFQDVCSNPFRPLPTETGLGEDWGFATSEFEEVVL